jgi:hypothetical protein
MVKNLSFEEAKGYRKLRRQAAIQTCGNQKILRKDGW